MPTKVATGIPLDMVRLDHSLVLCFSRYVSAKTYVGDW
jgi:hypothetical protein